MDNKIPMPKPDVVKPGKTAEMLNQSIRNKSKICKETEKLWHDSCKKNDQRIRRDVKQRDINIEIQKTYAKEQALRTKIEQIRMQREKLILQALKLEPKE